MSRRTIMLWVLVGMIGAALVFTGHGPHVIGYLPFLFLFACPLMHMFMHKGHHHGSDSSAHQPSAAGRESA